MAFALKHTCLPTKLPAARQAKKPVPSCALLPRISQRSLVTMYAADAPNDMTSTGKSSSNEAKMEGLADRNVVNQGGMSETNAPQGDLPHSPDVEKGMRPESSMADKLEGRFGNVDAGTNASKQQESESHSDADKGPAASPGAAPESGDRDISDMAGYEDANLAKDASRQASTEAR